MKVNVSFPVPSFQQLAIISAIKTNKTTILFQTYVTDKLTYDQIAGSLQTDCDESAVKVCPGDRCIASHIRQVHTEFVNNSCVT
jgi:hypothetical protein